MPETYPDDTTLLELAEDTATGVPYIPTGQSPYIMAYRQMLYRLLRATERANDLRVYPIGGRMVGVRAGRCFVGDEPRDVAEPSAIELAADATTHLYVNTSGTITTSTSGLPADRSSFIPLAQVLTDADSVTQLTDLRGEAMLQAQTAALAGITASSDEINQALDGIASEVTAAALSALTAGAESNADSLHQHLFTVQDIDGPATVTLANYSSDAAANIGLNLSMPNLLAGDSRLDVDLSNGFIRQTYLGDTYHLLGGSDLQWSHAGAFSSTVTGQLVGGVPISGEIVAVVLSCRLNTQSSDSGDGLALDAYVNGAALTAVSGSLTASDGSGFRSTDQGDGSSASLVTSGVEDVSRGDVITIDLTYVNNGAVSQQPTDVCVMFVIKADRPI